MNKFDKKNYSNRKNRIVKVRKNTSFSSSAISKSSDTNSGLTKYMRIGVTLLLAFSLIYILSYRGIEVRVVSGELTQDQTNQKIIDYYSNLSFYEKNYLLFPTSNLNNYIDNELNDVKNVDIDMFNFDRKIKLSLTGRTPAVIWQSNNVQYAVDIDGFLYKRISGTPDIPVVIDQSGLNVKLDTLVVRHEFVKFIREIDQEIQATKTIKPDNLILQSSSKTLIARTKNGYEVRFNTEEPAARQGESLRLTLDYINKKNLSVDSYIDLRIPGRTYIR